MSATPPSVWAAVSGIGGAAGVLFGGLLTEAGWRWVPFVNVPFSARLCRRSPSCSSGSVASRQLWPTSTRSAPCSSPAACCCLVYALVKAPDVGWGTTRTIAEPRRRGGPWPPSSSTSCASATRSSRSRSCASKESPPPTPPRCSRWPASSRCSSSSPSTCRPCSTTRRSRRTRLPAADGGFIISASISSQLFARIGTKPIVLLGSLIGAGGLYRLSRIPVDGSYVSDILPGLLVVSFGLGGVFTGLTTAANAGVGEDKAGLAAGLRTPGSSVPP